MKINHIKYFLIFVGLSILLYNIYPLISNLVHRENEIFLSMSILNKNGEMKNYFLDSTNVKVNDVHEWNINVENRGDVSSYVSLRIKLLDDQSELPDQNNCLPSVQSAIIEMKRIAPSKNRVNLPFKWKITNHDPNFLDLEINDKKIESVPITVVDGIDLTLVFELWVFDLEEDGFSFSWESRTVEQCIWNRMSFNLKLS